jgi:hypothetical protein
MPKIYYAVRVSVSGTMGGANLDYGTEQHEIELPEGCDEQDIFNAIAMAFKKLHVEA